MTTLYHEKAPAKINLTLHVLGRRQDGYHALESLVAFADTHDDLSLDIDAPLSLTMSGPTAAAAGDGPDNLVLKAARLFGETFAGCRLGAFHLVKRLPVAAGIGGGSSDAAAALRLLAGANAVSHQDGRLFEIARALGADVPVCLAPRARMMFGAGEQLGEFLKLQTLFAVLVNPRVAVETRAVFEQLALLPGECADFGPPAKADAMTRGLEAILAGRNDLEPPSIRLFPIIGEVLALLRRQQGCRLARMSGSGATCFALFDDDRSASEAAASLAQVRPDWWIIASSLG